MADIVIQVTDEREVELNKLTNELNLTLPSNQQITATQYLRRIVRDWLDLAITSRTEAERLRLRNRYNQATAQEKAAIDAILSRYQ